MAAYSNDLQNVAGQSLENVAAIDLWIEGRDVGTGRPDILDHALQDGAALQLLPVVGLAQGGDLLKRAQIAGFVAVFISWLIRRS